MKPTSALLLALALCSPAACSKEGTTADTTSNTPTTPAPVMPPTTTRNADNSARNIADRNGATTTPMDQGQNAADLEITRQIRRSILDDKNMSINAQNVKIITANGVVVLRGPVNTSDEKAVINTKAKAVAGVLSVDDQTEVKAQ